MRNEPPCPVREGDRIELLEMPNDPKPVPRGTLGTVSAYSFWNAGRNRWEFGVRWDTGGGLNIIDGVDVWRHVPKTWPAHSGSI